MVLDCKEIKLKDDFYVVLSGLRSQNIIIELYSQLLVLWVQADELF